MNVLFEFNLGGIKRETMHLIKFENLSLIFCVQKISKGSIQKNKTANIVNMVLPLLTPPPPPVIGNKNVGIVVSKFRPPHPLRR